MFFCLSLCEQNCTVSFCFKLHAMSVVNVASHLGNLLHDDVFGHKCFNDTNVKPDHNLCLETGTLRL